jgi:hypothetical protein
MKKKIIPERLQILLQEFMCKFPIIHSKYIKGQVKNACIPSNNADPCIQNLCDCCRIDLTLNCQKHQTTNCKRVIQRYRHINIWSATNFAVAHGVRDITPWPTAVGAARSGPVTLTPWVTTLGA